ncbi:MAG: T9SS type B sorting domain-containing protein [Flavobacteriaceae bacterium]|nr:T9SS type B sorting domain-containing protein [Flavobacteriaceae bacterium]
MDTTVTDAFGNTSVTIDCDYDIGPEVCVDLQVDYTPIASTNQYAYESIAFAPEIPFDQGTALTPSMEQLNGVVDDKFSEAIPLGFSFCFYDQVFTQIVIGTNGILTFNLDEAGADAPSGISVTNPNPALISNAIFAVQHDLLFDATNDSEIYYTTIGTAPCRKFIVNYYNAINFGCPGSSTVQIVIHEFTNDIEVHILEKPEHCPNGRDANALLGIMNNSGTQGISPPGRNTGEWSAHNESWRFFPSGNIPPVIVWYDDTGNEVGSGPQISVCPSRNTTYTAEVQYQSCVGNDLFGTDEIRVNFHAEFPAVENRHVFVCDTRNDGTETIVFASHNEFISLNNATLFNFSYYLSLNDAQNQTNPVSSYVINADTIVYVRIENRNNSNCYTITPINFSFTAAAISNLYFEMCDNNNDGVENNVNLVPHVEAILAQIDYLGYSIHATQQDANNQTNPITEANISSNTRFWLHLNIEGCEQVLGPIRIRFLEAPPDRATGSIFFETCDINFNHREPFEWQTEIRNIMTIHPGETFTVHTSYASAVTGTGNQTQISDTFPIYYVRVKNANGCFSIFEVPVTVEFFGVDVVPQTINLCFDGTEDITLNLNDYPELMLIDPLEGVEIFLYDNNVDAEANNTSNIINPIQTISEDGYLVTKTFYVRFQISEDCYTVRPINIRLVHPVVMQNPIDVCDIFNDNSEDENSLFIYDSLILGDQVGTVAYFTNQTDALNNQNAITNYNFEGNHTLWVRITSYNCSEVYPVDFQLISVPPSQNITMNLGEVCDVNQNGIIELNLTAFEVQVYEGTENVTFNYFLNYNPATEELTNPIENPALHPVTGNITFYIQILEENANCNAIAEVNLGIDFSQTFEINAAELYICDFQFDLNESFTLSDAYPQITNGLSNFNPDLYNISYHTNPNDLATGANAIEGDTFVPNSAAYPIYVRFDNLITGCVASNILTLYTVGAPKPVNGSTEVCDTNLNGLYDLDLTLLDNIVMENNTDGFIFTYHLTSEDAHAEINFLDSSDYYEADPFPTRIWVRVERELVEDCYDVNYVDITFTPLTELDITNLQTYGCDLENNGFATFDLSFVEQTFPSDQFHLTYYENLQQVIDREPAISTPTAYQNSSPYQSQVVVVVAEYGFCPTYAIIHLEYATVEVSIQPDTFCPGNSIDIVPRQYNSSDNYSYEWYDANAELISTSQILTDVTEATTFTLNVTNLDFPNCSKTYTVETHHYEPPVILDIVESGTTITVIASGLYPIEYSIDGVNWQGLNYFTGLQPGIEYIFYVRYIEQGCMGEPASGAIFIIPNVITPNGDGYNDEIRIENLHIFNGAASTFEVYDRYGKLVFSDSNSTVIVWNGKYLGRVLNSTDYWYILRIPDGREIKGSITVKNY